MKNFLTYLPLIIIFILVVVMFFVGKNNAVRLTSNTSKNEPFWKIL
jgi:hypothetical protein